VKTKFAAKFGNRQSNFGHVCVVLSFDILHDIFLY